MILMMSPWQAMSSEYRYPVAGTGSMINDQRFVSDLQLIVNCCFTIMITVPAYWMEPGNW